MNAEQLLTELIRLCESLRALLMEASSQVTLAHQRLEQIVQQLHKNIEVRDLEFSNDFNTLCVQLRAKLDAWEPAWAQARAQAREVKPAQWTADLALAAKGFNSQARALSKACDEFITTYDSLNRTYRKFTAAKLNMFLLTSCQSDAENLTAKILFLAREITKYTERNRGMHAQR